MEGGAGHGARGEGESGPHRATRRKGAACMTMAPSPAGLEAFTHLAQNQCSCIEVTRSARSNGGWMDGQRKGYHIEIADRSGRRR